MVRFRPIAPKPVIADSSASKDCKPDLVTQRHRSKRKYVRVKKVRKRNGIRTPNNDSTAEEDGKRGNDETVLTLQLLPPESSSSSSSNGSFLRDSPEKPFLIHSDKRGWTDQTDRKVVESWVIVDRMSDTWEGGELLGCTDTEKMKNLETDTCPGLISDALNRVQWMNPAYRKMVDPSYDGGAPWPEVVVRLIVIGQVLPAAFACTVRVVYTWQTSNKSQPMPCDVWKMEFGGFAWRLDAKAALCLGR